MPHVRFPQGLNAANGEDPGIHGRERPEVDVHGGTVRETLDAVFQVHPGLRGYVFDDHGKLRTQMVLFIDGELVEDRLDLSDPIDPDSELLLMQAVTTD